MVSIFGALRFVWKWIWTKTETSADWRYGDDYPVVIKYKVIDKEIYIVEQIIKQH